ncbi:MAG: peptidoglycan-binding protein [Clostridia bacterium]|nr:peptidoglycan-binding protein [Clostridia bacterium]
MSEEKRIWDAMLKFIGNPYGVAGLMGNLKAESRLEPCCLELKYRKKWGITSKEYAKEVDAGIREFCDSAGFGLAQWTYAEHKAGLLSYARYKGTSVADLTTQIEYLQADLNQFSSVLNVLRTAGSVREASDDVLLRYEKPANTGDKVKAAREKYGLEIFGRNADPKWVENNAKACAVISLARQRIGDPYVFGALGQDCTVANRQRYSDNDNCPRMSGKAKSCEGCKYKGGHIYDCRGFTYAMLKEAAGIVISTVGATTQWNTKADWLQRGETAAGMPDCVCCLFKKKDSKMSHTGLHIGGGQIIHCSGEVKTGVLEPSWTHWAVPVGLYSKEYLGTLRRIKAVATLKKGSTGAAVKQLQEDLKTLGYDPGTVDGVYGTATVKAVRQFQSDNGLTVDGIAGMATQAAVEVALEAKSKVKDDPADRIIAYAEAIIDIARGTRSRKGD